MTAWYITGFTCYHNVLKQLIQQQATFIVSLCKTLLTNSINAYYAADGKRHMNPLTCRQ